MQWMPELRRFAPNVPIVLVGTKLGMQLSSDPYHVEIDGCALYVKS